VGEIAGHTALVVGGGRGLGRSTALALAAEGASVMVAARTADDVAAVAGAVTKAGGSARAEVGDASIEADAERMIRGAVSWTGRLDVLVVCAGAALIKPLPDVSASEWDHVFAMNTRSVFLTNRAALRPMLAAGRGLIVNLASRVGVTGAANVVAYTAAKAAVIGFSRALALEVKPKGVRVTSLAPAPMDTPMRWSATPDFSRDKVIAPGAVGDLILYLARHPDVTIEDAVIPASIRY
jgi:NAD(P)-dependent dehydrogenase (short-subunit alcohol dehydrogenase family)